MKDANPIALVDDLSDVLSRYIATTLPIGRRYPLLAEKFREILREQRLVEGPYVEALPDFEKGESLEALLIKNGGFVNDAMGNIPTAGRKLHRHQQRALELAIREGKSLLVATGTGSGKTETFLYPIANQLLADPEPEKPGVRALLVYPMNALANDQLYYRIAPLFARYLQPHGITFGRYTGQVKAKVKREEEEARLLNNTKLMDALGYPDKVPANWRLTREEMLADPPKVLITNYAMLEHLLLLPRNERLFTANALRFIVLDEIHTYHGAQATEVGFLLRKLKNRLGIDKPVQVFGTSASLADGEGADEGLKSFASTLFGEEVHEVVRGKRIVHERLQTAARDEFSLSISDWLKVGTVLEGLVSLDEEARTADAWSLLVQDSGLQRDELQCESDKPILTFLEKRFSQNQEIRRVAQHLDRGGVRAFRDLATLIFDTPLEGAADEDKYRALSTVIRLGMLARASSDGFPLLPGRYHIAVNSIEGLAVLPSAGGEGWAQLHAARHHRTEEGQYFPLLTCRKCGQPFFEGFEHGGSLHNHQPGDREGRAERRVFWLGNPVGYVADEDDEVEAGPSKEYQKYYLDVVTGQLGATANAVAVYAIQTEHDEEERAWYVLKCPACGGSASGTDAEVVTRMHPGNEALGSVVAQRVLESLPPVAIDHYNPRPAGGRNLLTFSDNRQDAAFFAPYFERTAADLALRSAIRNVLRERSSPVTGSQLAEQVYQHWQQDGEQAVLLDANGEICHDHQDMVALLLAAIGREMCTPGGRRNSVEALGIVQVTYDEAKLRLLFQKVKTFWPGSLPASDAAISALTHLLIENIRRERALSRFHKVALSDEFVWGLYNGHRSFDLEGGDDAVRYKWIPSKARHNRRSWYLVEQLGMQREEATLFLRQFWEALKMPSVALLERHMPGFALNGDLIRFGNGDKVPLYACKSCGLMQQNVIGHKCTAFNCRGDVEELTVGERAELRRRNHYLASYDEANHSTVRAREHTASLSTELRESIERDFAERKINLLCCTTTMEMGVDLGDLEAVVNLNVPPGIANYQQRTGRAGRRAQAAPFCVTVARNTNFDQMVVREFPRYLASSPGTPFIHLDNQELFTRHQFSVLLSYFLRRRIANGDINAPSLKHFFGEAFTRDDLSAFTDGLMQWLESADGRLATDEAEGLCKKLPSELDAIGARGAHLRELFLAAVREFAEEVCERFGKYSERISEAATASDFKKASYWQGMRDDFMGQLLVDQLSRRGLIPTYSFPVHSLNLEVLNEASASYFGSKSEVVLSRDASLGISEYAPGAEVVANGRIWESAGLAHYPKAFMPERWYVACPECFHVDIGDSMEDVPPACSNCGSAEGRRKRKFVEPHGFVTSFAERRGRDPGSSRRRVKAADEAKLIAAPREDVFEDTGLPFLSSALLSAKARGDGELTGTLFIANRGAYGEGYRRCYVCNYCEPVGPQVKGANAPMNKATPKGSKTKLVHKDPQTGLTCKNDVVSQSGLDFVHQFHTDVRILRFVQTMPDPESPDMPPRRYHERVARTVSEALRLAATRLLSLHPGEVRAIYRLSGARGSALEVVLYDGVPGGAGYCARIGEPGYSFSALIDAARTSLDCPEGCESGCRVCLCDYANQRYWDSFERKAALSWLNGLVDPNVGVNAPGSYIRWAAPSVAGLADRLANYNEISFVVRSLVDVGDADENSVSQLLKWLQGGKTVNVYLVNKLDEKPRAQAPLTVYRRLQPYVFEGRLRLFAIPEKQGSSWQNLPRIFAGTALNMPVVRQYFAAQSLLGQMIAGPADIGVVDEPIREALTALSEAAVPYGVDALKEGERMGMWELHEGEPRKLDHIFAPLKGGYVKRLEIRDPYCAAPANVGRLEALLKYAKSAAASIEYLNIRCRETKERDGYVEFYLDVERRIDGLVSSMGFENRDVEVIPLKRSSKSFHDREIDITIVSEDGCEEVHRYFLTGGVDYLLNERVQTRVFYLRLR
ncbi:DEAD/DEAH box helicase [Burkholderia vietnamiensis]|uniref:DEAD/DEAH box helicase n=1 Tax=Burkholderia vietnamiensis TaxID=60552 RepID=UPI001CF0DC39|nr:DEAD/DEAH box helicase [Burkholderia vietnamiensis]MCA8197868.1 DEAD/DEAH box helicase [Burkholderia vietnamiensis]